MNDILKCKSYSDLGKFLGYNYYNKHVKNKVIDYCNNNNIDLEQLLAKEKKYCLFCGKEISNSKKFCDSSCAASFNNKKRTHSNETKNKISNSLKHTLNKQSEIKERECIICGKHFIPQRTTKGYISHSNTCSKECHFKLSSMKSKEVMEKLKIEGKHKGWASRNIISYPEKFWIEVLNNNNIPFLHNFPFGKYFLDFYIEIAERKIDLEIDGKQHKYIDRALKDKERDNYVTSNNIEVYRVDWVSINNDCGKEKIKKEIENFLKFIKKI